MNRVITCITGDIDSGESETIQCLTAYFDVLDKYDIKATIPVTAKAVEDYPERIEYILKRGHEIAGHGDIHQGFHGSVSEQVRRLRSMINTINDVLGVEVTGFRAPWYKHDRNTYIALSEVGLQYDSSQKRFEIAFKRIPRIEKEYVDFKHYNLIKPILVKTAQCYNFFMGIKKFPCYIADGVIEIPALGISDYTLIDSPKGPKYTPGESEKIGMIWLECFKQLTVGGGVFVLQAHPGRVSPTYISGLDYFIKNALKHGATFKTLSSITSQFKNNLI
jgi:peptidoglycan/xylan/chitin deacetylase (PgdA/CDA1 family)